MIHHVFRIALRGNLSYTRLNNPQKILDVGTGTGIWAMDGEFRCQKGSDAPLLTVSLSGR